MKLNHNELLTYPNKFDQIMFGTVQQACDLGAAGVGATIYFGSEESTRQLQEVSEAFAEAHELGMFTVLWCYLRNNAFKKDGVDYHVSADLTGQANHLGVTIEADIIKQKLPENNGGYTALELRQDVAARLRRADHRPPDRPLPLAGGQLLHGPHRAHQLAAASRRAPATWPQAVRTAVINKRAGGMGLISGRKAFQRPMAEGVELLNAIQDVYLDRGHHRRLTRSRPGSQSSGMH